jgi:hypothetical protein
MTASPSRANGDPASDVLYTRNVFVPYPPPPNQVTEALEHAVAAAYARRYRVKVAVIATRTDLGSVPELFNKPSQYARFLGIELDAVFAGPLLIVMPSGFGIYDAGRSTAAEERVLAKMSVGDGSPDGLTRAAETAVRKMTAAGALRSKDIRAPVVVADPVTVARGATAKLRYTIIEDSQRTREVVRVWSGTSLRKVIRTRLRAAIAQEPHVVRWRIPGRDASHLRFCVVAVDPAGNASRKVCAAIVVAG